MSKQGSFARNINRKVAICQDCNAKYPRIRDGALVDYDTLKRHGCEVCEGDTNPALFGYGTEEQQSEARRLDGFDQ